MFTGLRRHVGYIGMHAHSSLSRHMTKIGITHCILIMLAAVLMGNEEAQANEPGEPVTFELNARPSEGALADPERRMVVSSEVIPNSVDRIPDGLEFSIGMDQGRTTSRQVQSCGGYIAFTIVPPDQPGEARIQATSADNVYHGELLYTFVGVPTNPIHMHAIDRREVDGEVRVTLSTGPVTDKHGTVVAGGRLYAKVSGAAILSDSDDNSVITLDADGVGFLELGVLNEETGEYAAPGEEWEFEVALYLDPDDDEPIDTYTLSSDTNIFSDWEGYDEAQSDKAMQWEHAEEGVRLGLSAHPRTDGDQTGHDLEIIGDGVFRTYPGAMTRSEIEKAGWDFEYYVEAPEDFEGSVRLHYDLAPGENAAGDLPGEVVLAAPPEGVGASWNLGFRFLAGDETEELPDEALSVEPPSASFSPYATGPYGFTLKAYDADGELLGGPGVTVVVREPVAPDVQGEVLEDAETILMDEGLVSGEVTHEFSFDIPEGRVISQSPAAGEPVPDSRVDLVVSAGLDPDAVFVPDVVEMRRGEAEALLQEEGLRVGNIRYEYSSEAPRGHVISQSPRAGEPVLADSQVALVVSDGPEPGTTDVVPHLWGLRRDDAEAELEASGFRLGEVRFEVAHTPPQGHVSYQEPWGGASAEAGSEVSIWLSVGGAEPPDLVEMWPRSLVPASEGDDIVLSVLIYAEYEEEARVRWIFTETNQEIESGPELALMNVSEYDAGTYMVEVTHPEYPLVRETHMVEVRFMDFAPAPGALGLSLLTLFGAAYGVRRIRR